MSNTARPPFWCVGLSDSITREPCGKPTYWHEGEPPAGWQPLCNTCMAGLRAWWKRDDDETAWSLRVGQSRVYVAQRGPFLKVGKSEQVATRLANLADERDATRRPEGCEVHPFELLATFPGHLREEQALHRHLHSFELGVVGEWFRNTAECRLEIRDWILGYADAVPAKRVADFEIEALNQTVKPRMAVA